MDEVVRRRRREILVFEIGGRRYGLPASEVRELLRAVTILPLPLAPAVVEGVINLRGVVAGSAEEAMIDGKDGTTGGSVPDFKPGMDPVEKILSGLKGITSMEGEVTVKYKKSKGADGSENMEVEVHVGASVGKE